MLPPDTTAHVRTASQRAAWAARALTAVGAAHLLHALALGRLMWFLRALEGGAVYDDAAAAQVDALVQVASLLPTGALVVSAVTFLLWLHQIVRAALLLAPESRSVPSPGEAVAAFFIPVLNLVRPYQHARALHDGLDVEGLAQPPAKLRVVDVHYRENPAEAPAQPIPTPAAPLGSWWALWVASNGLLNITARHAPSQELGAMTKAVWLQLGADALRVVAVALAVLVVRRMDARLRERHRRLVDAPDPSPEAPVAA